MPKLKITTQARLSAIMPGAVAGGYTLERIAKECGCGRNTAAKFLKAYRSEIETAAALDRGRVADEVRRVATLERRAATDRIANLGALADDLLAEASARLCPPLCAVDGLGGVGGASVRPGLPLEDLESLARIVVRAGKLAESSWRLFRSTSGLDLAEKLTEAKARERIKAGEDLGEVWEADFELLEPGQ